MTKNYYHSQIRLTAGSDGLKSLLLLLTLPLVSLAKRNLLVEILQVYKLAKQKKQRGITMRKLPAFKKIINKQN